MAKAHKQPEAVLPGLASAIRATSSARIFRRIEETSDDFVGTLLNLAAGRNSEIKERLVRLDVDSIKVSYVVFAKTTQVSFLKAQEFKDINHGFLLMLEYGELLFCFYSKANLPIEEIELKFRKIEYQSLVGARMAGSINLQKIRTKAMINTFDGCHNRTFEGQNLQSRLGSRVNHRQILTSTSVRKGRRRSSVHFSLSKITDLGARRDLKELLEWTVSTAAVIEETGEGIDPFLLTYAQECELPEDVEPLGIVFHVWELEEYFNSDNGRLLIDRGNGKPLTDDQRSKILDALSQKIELVKDEKKTRSYQMWRNLDDDERQLVGRMTMSERGVKVRLRGLKAVKYESDDGKEMTLNALISKGGHYSVVFNDPTYYHTDGRTVRDADIIERAKSLLNILVGVEALDPQHCQLENGESVDLEGYPVNSIFCIIDEALRFSSDRILVCDDGPREWADFIEFSFGQKPELVFYHAKRDRQVTSGASAFHVVVAQALKHLGQVTRSGTEFVNKLDSSWAVEERFGIARIRSVGVDRSQAAKGIRACVGELELVRKVSLVVNFLSKSDFAAAIDEGVLDEHRIQQIWLINEFVSSCWDLGLTPEILCAT